MDEERVAEVLRQRGYDDIPKDLLTEFVQLLNNDKDIVKKPAKQPSQVEETENSPKQANKRKPKKKKAKKQKKEKDLTPKNLCNFVIEDDVTKFSNEMKRLQQDANELLGRFNHAIQLFQAESFNEEEEDSEN